MLLLVRVVRFFINSSSTALSFFCHCDIVKISAKGRQSHWLILSRGVSYGVISQWGRCFMHLPKNLFSAGDFLFNRLLLRRRTIGFFYRSHVQWETSNSSQSLFAWGDSPYWASHLSRWWQSLCQWLAFSPVMPWLAHLRARLCAQGFSCNWDDIITSSFVGQGHPGHGVLCMLLAGGRAFYPWWKECNTFFSLELLYPRVFDHAKD